MLRPFSAAPLPFGSTGVSLRPCQLRAPDPRERIVLCRRLLFFTSNFHASEATEGFDLFGERLNRSAFHHFRQIYLFIQYER